MKRFLLFIALACAMSVTAFSAEVDPLLRKFSSRMGYGNCAHLADRYTLPQGDRAVLISDQDFDQVVFSMVRRHPAMLMGAIPEHFVLWKKQKGEDVLLALITEDNEVCVMASIAVDSLSVASEMRKKYFPE